ncbi:hypothetical protein BJX99DRAFT_263076 [Aspergillus californicus]
MADSRRRQNHSCDPCRKGKRGCDAPEIRPEGAFTSCSNCIRWKKKCTFNFATAKRSTPGTVPARSRTKAKGKTTSTTSVPQPAADAAAAVDITGIATPESGDFHAILDSYNSLLDQGLLSNPGDMLGFSDSSNPASAGFVHTDAGNTHGKEPDLWSIGVGSEGNWQADLLMDPNMPPSYWQPKLSTTTITQEAERFFSPLESQKGICHALEDTTPDDDIMQALGHGSNTFSSVSALTPSSDLPWTFLNHFSETTATKYARSTITANMLRIYHDSMENALSCWLTEHNCPYADKPSSMLPSRQIKEWGPAWSNRMCLRVCRLDRVSSSLRGRALSAQEDGMAARALHLAIVAFASQWTQHAEGGTGFSVPEDIARDERTIRRNTWNEARHALQRSSGIPSFRVIFANIIFSLTQAPLDELDGDGDGNARLDRLLENDGAPTFLEAANRQLYTFRYKYARMRRQAPVVREVRRGSIASTFTEGLEEPIVNPPVDPLLSSPEHRSTLSLMFWLGIMFDTLTAAMYQRPLVVSDEDSQVSTLDLESDSSQDINLDCWEPHHRQKTQKADVWGALFLRSPTDQHQMQPRWPCSYETAASILSEATPVKVLLYRRVTQLQTLLYRAAPPTRLESVIRETLLVYAHWTRKYHPFMLDCVANHALLPSRIQSWYVILAGHWHLAAMLLADVLEEIDRGSGLGLDTDRENRQRTQLVSTLRMENAIAVAGLARASLSGQNPGMAAHYHDSLNEVAFLVEPWTVVLVHSFAKAAYILLDALHVDVSVDLGLDLDLDAGDSLGLGFSLPGSATARLSQNCHFCICALQYLGRKSDMASLVARNLARALDLKLIR